MDSLARWAAARAQNGSNSFVARDQAGCLAINCRASNDCWMETVPYVGSCADLQLRSMPLAGIPCQTGSAYISSRAFDLCVIAEQAKEKTGAVVGKRINRWITQKIRDKFQRDNDVPLPLSLSFFPIDARSMQEIVMPPPYNKQTSSF